MSFSLQEQIRVLHVDDDPSFTELTATYLERESDQFAVETATSVAEGLNRLTEDVDCVISDYDMPGANGIEFLQTVREEFPDLPFVLFTGKGSEEVASDAISAGVTDYLQKEPGSDQFVVLANRVANAVTQARAECRLQEERQRFQILFDRLTQPTVEVEYEGDEPVVQQVNPAFEAVFGYDAAEVVGESLDAYIVPEGTEEEASQINQRVRDGQGLDSLEVTRTTTDGEQEFLLQNAVYDDGSGGFALYTDITDRKHREQRLEARRRQLADLLDATRRLTTAESRDEAAACASDTARDVLDLPLNAVLLHDPDREALVPAAADSANGTCWDPPVVGPGDGDAWTAYRTGQAQIHADAGDTPDPAGAGTPTRTECYVPVGTHGVLVAASPVAGDFTEADTTCAKILAAHLEVALDRADRHQRQQERLAALQALHETTQTFMTASDPQTVASRAVETARTVLDQPINSVWLYNEETEALEPAACTDEAREVIDTMPTYTGEGSLSWAAFETGEAEVYDTLHAEPDRYNPETPLASEMVLPLGEFGVMNLGATDQQAFDEIDRSLARTFGGVVETALDRIKRERDLARSRELLQHTEDLAQTGGWEADAETGQQRWTRGTYAIHDVEPGADFDPTIQQGIGFYHPADRSQIEQVVERCLERCEPFDEELRLITAENRQRWVRTTGEAVTDGDSVTAIRGAIRDVTERRQRETELRREQQRFETLFDQLTQPLVEVEYDGLEPVVQRVNPAFEAVFGYDAAEIVGESLDAYIVPDDHQAEAEEINEHVSEGGRLVSREVTRQTADGLREFLLENAVYEDNSGGFAVYTEISDRKRREEALGELHNATQEFTSAQNKQAVADRAVETARAALDQPISGLWLYDQNDNTLQPVAATENGTEVFGRQPTYTPGESLSWQVFQNGELQVCEDVRTEPERLNAETAVRSEILVPLGEHGVMNISATEPEAFSEIDVSLVRILGEAVEAALDRADREQQLRTQRAALERQNARLEKFIGAVSHDLRNPLQLATGRVQIAQEVCDSAHLSDAVAALERMDTLISDLLTVARSGEQVGEVQCVALGSVSGDCWRTVATDGASLAVETQQMVRADSSRLRQLLENLFSNAVTHGGENVTVTVGDLPDGFYVADDGSGVPADERERMFETGYSTTADGTGFGLDIVREIAQGHGWELAVTDSDSGGARFELTGVELVD